MSLQNALIKALQRKLKDIEKLSCQGKTEKAKHEKENLKELVDLCQKAVN